MAALLEAADTTLALVHLTLLSFSPSFFLQWFCAAPDTYPGCLSAPCLKPVDTYSGIACSCTACKNYISAADPSVAKEIGLWEERGKVAPLAWQCFPPLPFPFTLNVIALSILFRLLDRFNMLEGPVRHCEFGTWHRHKVSFSDSGGICKYLA